MQQWGCGSKSVAELRRLRASEHRECVHEASATWVQDDLVAPVPEPSTYALMGGLAAIAFPVVRRFRRRR